MTGEIFFLRGGFILILALAGFLMQPFALQRSWGALMGGLVGAAIVLVESRVRQANLKRLIGAAVGSLLGISGAYLFTQALSQALPRSSNNLSFVYVLVLIVMTYVGLMVGAAKGEMLNLAALGGLLGGEKPNKEMFKLLDTSVIIDGRIADIAETGFLEGVLVIPQFVLRELQLVADSPEPVKRNRGRRGLDILQRLQKSRYVKVQILDEDVPGSREVDMKLVELGKLYGCKIITNDFNLNKVARLHGVEVLNVNELANALKPVVLPGETMQVHILKEGKEPNQGIAYLDDGTMVVVENGRRMISKTVEITVTSVLQTAAGKMIFGRLEERQGGTSERGVNDRSDAGRARVRSA